MEGKRPEAVSLVKIPLEPSRWGCPTTSSIFEGRILSANGTDCAFIYVPAWFLSTHSSKADLMAACIVIPLL
ncbi:MAG: hypothetical protein LBQ86_04010, partial [Holophagales bacterium]|nr:hypothetical protein [Holophagales bacterium]